MFYKMSSSVLTLDICEPRGAVRDNLESCLYQYGHCLEEKWQPDLHTWSVGVSWKLPGRQGAPEPTVLEQLVDPDARRNPVDPFGINLPFSSVPLAHILCLPLVKLGREGAEK